ncbi:MAG: amidohydrolase family protein [Armatimonadota bacterium]|nr:amidohydrolase family protein [Armatimonadota bacterium]
MQKIDMHAHLGHWAFAIPNSGTVESLLHLCERYDIRYVAASSTHAIVYDMQSGNEEMAEAAREHEWLLMYVYANPNVLDQSCAEMDRYLPEDFAVGVKIHCNYSATGTGEPRMHDLMAEIARRTSLVKIHPGAAEDLAQWARVYRDLNIIIAHSFAASYAAAVDLALAHSNIYLDFCSSQATRGRVRYALDRCGPGQIVFGSDMDLLDPAWSMGIFEGADLTDEERQAVYWDNAARLLGVQ